MNGKMVLGIALVLGILSVAFLAAPALAYVNGDEDRARLRTRDQTCNGDMLQIQNRYRLRTQDGEYDYDDNCTQYRERARIETRFRNCVKNLEQNRNQSRHGTNNP